MRTSGSSTRAGLPVPDGFVVTAGGYLRSLDALGIRDRVRDRFDAVLRLGDTAEMSVAIEELRSIIRAGGLPETVASAITDSYGQLGDDVAVAVRSSATAEDTAGASFAGMHESFANTIGVPAVLEAVLECWVSLFSARAIAYRARRGIVDEPAIAVVVQRMAPCDRAGVMFTTDPVGTDADVLVIEAAHGLGELVVGGAVVPDTYLVTKNAPAVLSVRAGSQEQLVTGRPGGSVATVAMDPSLRGARVLSDREVLEVARLGLQIEANYGVPQDVEWTIGDGRVWIVQSRPITTRTPEPVSGVPRPLPPGGGMLLRGLGASGGEATGRVRILTSPRDGRRLVDGEVLVAPTTSPDWVPAMRRAAAVVTDSGGLTSHAAIVTREIGVPCVVGTTDATAALHDGDLVHVDGTDGTVQMVDGDAPAPVLRPAATSERGSATVSAAPADSFVPLGTRVYVNVAVPPRAPTPRRASPSTVWDS